MASDTGSDRSDHAIASAADAVRAFNSLLGRGDFLRFHSTQVPDTEGGWLYRLEDDAAVVGLSGDAYRAGAALRVLQEAVPGGVCCDYGDQPPPDTRREFLALVRG